LRAAWRCWKTSQDGYVGKMKRGAEAAVGFRHETSIASEARKGRLREKERGDELCREAYAAMRNGTGCLGMAAQLKTKNANMRCFGGVW